MSLMALLVLSRSDCFRKNEVEGTTESVVMEDIGPDNVFLEGEMARNNYCLGL